MTMGEPPAGGRGAGFSRPTPHGCGEQRNMVALLKAPPVLAETALLVCCGRGTPSRDMTALAARADQKGMWDGDLGASWLSASIGRRPPRRAVNPMGWLAPHGPIRLPADSGLPLWVGMFPRSGFMHAKQTGAWQRSGWGRVSGCRPVVVHKYYHGLHN